MLSKSQLRSRVQLPDGAVEDGAVVAALAAALTCSFSTRAFQHISLKLLNHQILYVFDSL